MTPADAQQGEVAGACCADELELEHVEIVDRRLGLWPRFLTVAGRRDVGPTGRDQAIEAGEQGGGGSRCDQDGHEPGPAQQLEVAQGVLAGTGR